MQNPHFIVNRSVIEEKKKSLSKINEDNENWTSEYIDSKSDENWIEYRVNPEFHGGGYPILVKLPEPDIDELIRIALESGELDEIAGAAIFLYCNERDSKTEFREKLIDRIEKYYTRLKKTNELNAFNKTKIKTIIYESDLYSELNLRNTLGKSFKEIEADHQFYKSISKRAKKVLNEIKEK